MFSINVLKVCDHVIDYLIIIIFIATILPWFKLKANNILVRLVNSIVDPVIYPISILLPPVGDTEISHLIVVMILFLTKWLLHIKDYNFYKM